MTASEPPETTPERLVRSRQRIADHGEVFTPRWLVDEMLDLLHHETRRVESRFLEPACGSGNFLVPVLERKLAAVDAEHGGDDPGRKRSALRALACVYGIELLPDNVAECRARLRSTLIDFLGVPDDGVWACAASTVLARNIIAGDALGMVTSSGAPIAFADWGDPGCTGDRGRGLGLDALGRCASPSHAHRETAARFDVVIGNPPYQLATGGGRTTRQARPQYHLFVERAKELEPRYVCMVTPSRWFSGGLGLDRFRAAMLSDRRLRTLVDFPDSRDAFAGVDIAGGVSYFLWDRTHCGPCSVATAAHGERGVAVARRLDAHEVLIRDNAAVRLVDRVRSSPDFSALTPLVSAISPFGLPTSFRGRETPAGLAAPIIIRSTDGRAFAERSAVTKNADGIDRWKVLLSATASEHAGQAGRDGRKRVFSRIEVAEPGVAMTHSYLSVGPLDDRAQAEHLAGYLRTRFVRFLASLAILTQHISRSAFAFVPVQDFTRSWSDAELAAKYGLTRADSALMESRIRGLEPEPRGRPRPPAHPASGAEDDERPARARSSSPAVPGGLGSPAPVTHESHARSAAASSSNAST